MTSINPEYIDYRIRAKSVQVLRTAARSVVRYDIVRKLGRGLYGIVWHCRRKSGVQYSLSTEGKSVPKTRSVAVKRILNAFQSNVVGITHIAFWRVGRSQIVINELTFRTSGSKTDLNSNSTLEWKLFWQFRSTKKVLPT